MYHPLLVFDGQTGHLITALLRAGNTHASNSSVAVLGRIVSRLRQRWPEVEIEVRADAGFAVPAVYDYCEEEGISYTIALITNPRLLEMAEELLEEAREEHERTARKARLFSEDLYAAASWERGRRVVYKAEVMEQGTNRRFVLTTRSDAPKVLYEFYAKRGEAEIDQPQCPRTFLDLHRGAYMLTLLPARPIACAYGIRWVAGAAAVAA